jgi:pre-mRNA-splicing factor SYF1
MREMLRIRQSVQATYNTQINMMSVQMLATSGMARTVSDLGPKSVVSVGDDAALRLLEAKAAVAAAVASEAEAAKPGLGQPGGAWKILFVRGQVSRMGVLFSRKWQEICDFC